MSTEHRVIHEQGKYRVLEIADATHWDLGDLVGDGATQEEREHLIDLANREGIFGYVLEQWDPRVDGGWVHVDSCWGFIGQYTPSEETFNHYIVDELIKQIPGGAK